MSFGGFAVIEHAVYASTRSQQRDGYQVVARSPGIAPEDVRELFVWCPSHNGLTDGAGGTPSVNAFPLPSGAHCVSRSFAADAEYSGRGGTHVVTDALVLSAEDFRRFANNPFAVMQAAVAGGHALAGLPGESRLAPFRLLGRTRVFDRALVRQAIAKHSLERFIHALDVGLTAESVVVAAEDGTAQLVASLLNCIPVGLRRKISLATGLAYSASRPYQWLAHPADFILLRRLERNEDVRVVNLASPSSVVGPSYSATPNEVNHAWAACVHACLVDQNYAELEQRIRETENVTNVAELDRQAAELVMQLN